MTGIKICGIRDTAIIDEAAALGCDYAGLIFFAKSPRNVSVEQAAKLAAHARGKIKSVAVLVDADVALLSRIASEVKPDFLQLHGDETPARVAEIKTKFGISIIRAIKVQRASDIAIAAAYAAADMLLFDAKPPKGALPGGNAVSFDWTLLQNQTIPLRSSSEAVAHLNLPWMLSGGLNAGNVAEAIRISGARAVDVSSGVESAPGVKDVNKMREFVKAVHGIPTTR